MFANQTMRLDEVDSGVIFVEFRDDYSSQERTVEEATLQAVVDGKYHSEAEQFKITFIRNSTFIKVCGLSDSLLLTCTKIFVYN